MTFHRSNVSILFGILLIAALLRFWGLEWKPAHFDEGVNGWFVDQMQESGFFRYDPGNYHGPFHFYVLFVMQTLFGRGEAVLRFPLVLINLATVGLIFSFRRFLPAKTSLFAGAAFAASAGMVFYSRYAIHEAWLVFGLLLSLWGYAEWISSRTKGGLWAMVMGVTLLILTKETYLIHLVGFGLALGTVRLLERFTPSTPLSLSSSDAKRPFPRRSFMAALGVALFSLIFFYSGNFLDFSALEGPFTTFSKWMKTGAGEENFHSKEWWYWLDLMARYEYPALAGLLISPAVLWPGTPRLIRLIATYGCGVLVGYSIVRYKTPWCIVSLIWPFYFVLGWGIESFSKWLGSRFPARPSLQYLPFVAGGVLLLASLYPTIRLNFFEYTNPEEKYVYVQSMEDLNLFKALVLERARANPAAYHERGHIILDSYHPLPWILGQFTSLGYYDKGLPEELDAAFLIVDAQRADEVEAALKESYIILPFQLRDAMEQGRLFLNRAQFSEIVEKVLPETEEEETIVLP